MPIERIEFHLTRTEREWVEHAARLKRQSLREYIVRAVNASLRREGVDAVLIKERESVDD